MELTADQLRGRVCVLIDGEEKLLRFDQGALAQLIDKLGVKGISEIPSAISSLEGETLCVLVWAGRLWEEPKLNLEDVNGWFFPLLPTYQAAIEAINLSLWGELKPDLGGGEDDADPTMGTEGSGTLEAQEILQ